MQIKTTYQRWGPAICAAALLAAPAAAQLEQDVTATLETFDLAHVIVPPGRPESFDTTVFMANEEISLELKRVSVWADGAVVEVHRQDGKVDFLPAPVPNTYSGRVVGSPGSVLTAALTANGFHASIQIPGRELRMVEPVDGSFGVHAVYRAQDVVSEPLECDESPVEERPVVPFSTQPQGASRAGNVFVAELALDTDFEYCLTWLFNTAAILDELSLVVSNANALGFNLGGTGIQHILTKAVLRFSSADPYSSTTGSTVNAEQVAEWTANQTQTPYDLVLLFTGKDTCSATCSLAGRANVIGGVCNRDTAFCFTEFRTNDITQFQIAAHELGHLWSGRHCDNDPGSGCIGVGPCPLMCSTINGCDNIIGSWGFAPCNRDRVIALRNSLSCLDMTTDVKWVEWRNSLLIGAGSIVDPYNRLAIAVSAVASGGTIVIFQGQSSTSPLELVPLVINKDVTIRSFNGPATVNN